MIHVFGPVWTRENTWRVQSNAELNHLVNGASIVSFIKAWRIRRLKQYKNGLFKDGKKNIRMETGGEATDRKFKNSMAGWFVYWYEDYECEKLKSTVT